MRYRSRLTIRFDAPSHEQARAIATTHHAQLHDLLAVEGADHPFYISLDHLCADTDDSSTDLLDHDVKKRIE